MLEYRSLKKSKAAKQNSWEYSWSKMHKDSIVRPGDFKLFEFKVFGKVYRENSAEFEKALNDAKLWKALSD